MARTRSAWSASGEIRMSIGLPMTLTPRNTITVIASTTNRAWIRRRNSQVVMRGACYFTGLMSNTRFSSSARAA